MFWNITNPPNLILVVLTQYQSIFLNLAKSIFPTPSLCKCFSHRDKFHWTLHSWLRKTMSNKISWTPQIQPMPFSPSSCLSSSAFLSLCIKERTILHLIHTPLLCGLALLVSLLTVWSMELKYPVPNISSLQSTPLQFVVARCCLVHYQ
jgi:hypothetical protein